MVDDKDIDNRIFVKGFPRETTDNDLKTFFETYGTVTHANIVKDKKSGGANYGFVNFESKEVRDNLVKEKSIKFQGKTLCIDKAVRRKGFPQKNYGDSAAHGFRRCLPSTRPLSMDYSSATTPMGYYPWPAILYNSPAVQASAVAQIPSPSYQPGYIPGTGSYQVFTTLMPGTPSSSSFVQSINSGEPLLFQAMPQTSYVDGYTDYQSIPSYIPLPLSSVWQRQDMIKESMSMSPKTKGKKSFQAYVKEEEESSDVSSESSQVPVAAVLPTTKEIVSP